MSTMAVWNEPIADSLIVTASSVTVISTQSFFMREKRMVLPGSDGEEGTHAPVHTASRPAAGTRRNKGRWKRVK